MAVATLRYLVPQGDQEVSVGPPAQPAAPAQGAVMEGTAATISARGGRV